MPENETRWRSHRTSDKWALLKKKVLTTNLTSLSYLTKLIVIVLTNINVKSHRGSTYGHTTILKVPRKTYLGCFSKNTLSRSEKPPVVAAIIHKNLTLIIFFTSKESLPTGNLLRHTWNTLFKHLPKAENLK